MSKELRSKLESVDVVQDTLIHALSGLDDFTYKNEGDFVRWLSKIAKNELRGSLKKLHADKRDIRTHSIQRAGSLRHCQLFSFSCAVTGTVTYEELKVKY
jgi:DNA-directed RNA polymerase specialized sigma24 family protein